MKKEEETYLVDGKTNSGKSRDQAREELRYFKESQKGFKDLKKENRRLESELKKKDNLIEKLQKKHFQNIIPAETRTKQKSKKIKNNKNEEVTLKELNRIMMLIDSEKKIGLSDLTKTCMLKSKTVKGALNFLERNNFVRERLDGRILILERVG